MELCLWTVISDVFVRRICRVMRLFVQFLWGSPSGGGGGLFGSILVGFVPLAFRSAYPIIIYSVAKDRSILVTFRQMCNLGDPNLP